MPPSTTVYKARIVHTLDPSVPSAGAVAVRVRPGAAVGVSLCGRRVASISGSGCLVCRKSATARSTLPTDGSVSDDNHLYCRLHILFPHPHPVTL